MTKEDFDQLPVVEKIEACTTKGKYYKLYTDQNIDVSPFPPEEDQRGPYFPMPAHVYHVNDFFVIEYNGYYGRRFYTTKTDPFTAIWQNKLASSDRELKKDIRIIIIVAAFLYLFIPLVFVYLGTRQHVPSIKDYVFTSLLRLNSLLALLLRFVIKWVYVGGFFLLVGFPVILLYIYVKEDVLHIHK